MASLARACQGETDYIVEDVEVHIQDRLLPAKLASRSPSKLRDASVVSYVVVTKRNRLLQ